MPPKALRLMRGLAGDRTLYPALRLGPSTRRTPAGALAELGLDAALLDLYERDYDRVAQELFPALLARAQEVGSELAARKLERPDLPAHDAKKLLYLAVRALRPEVAVETGTYNGTFSTFILAGLRDNGAGRLVSFDLPAYKPIPRAIDTPLPAGQKPGWIVPDELRDRLEVVLGHSRKTLPGVLHRGPIDLFLHDSLHTPRHMLFEYRWAWKALRPGSLLVSDDVFMTHAFWWFTRRRRVPFLHIGAMGVTRKPAD